MAYGSLLSVSMRRRYAGECRGTLLLLVNEELEDVRGFADSVSLLTRNGIDVVVADGTPPVQAARNECTLRWVARYVRAGASRIDVLELAQTLAVSQKIIVARSNVRYELEDIDRILTLLDEHEVVEPDLYIAPLPWWGAADAARILIHRAIDAEGSADMTFAFRKTALRGLRNAEVSGGDAPMDRLREGGAEIHHPANLFVRRVPAPAHEWWAESLAAARADFLSPVKTLGFSALLPSLLVLWAFGGWAMTTIVAATMTLSVIVLAAHGRRGAAAFYPFHVCLVAPLWIAERSLAVYWVLLSVLAPSHPAPDTLQSGPAAANARASGE